MLRPYAIWSPPWDHKVGGIRALYELAFELQARGHEATIHIEGSTAYDREAIAVYPEIVRDSPLGLDRIVRWRLAPAEVPDDGLTVDWIDYGWGNPTMAVDLIDHEMFARREGPRCGAAVWVHKGSMDPSQVPGQVAMMTADWPATREGVADLLASVEVLISFDEFSLVNLEALLLGTPVLLHPSGRFDRRALEAQGWPLCGVAWSPDELESAREATKGAWPWYLGECERMAHEIDRFIDITQARWPSSG